MAEARLLVSKVYNVLFYTQGLKWEFSLLIQTRKPLFRYYLLYKYWPTP